MLERRILIVDGDAAMREALAAAMSQLGAEVVLAKDGVDALQQLRVGSRPAVIMLDLEPRLGDEFLRHLRADPRYEHVPVITMTAGAGPAEGAEIVARLQKPFDMEDLREIVMSLFEAV